MAVIQSGLRDYSHATIDSTSKALRVICVNNVKGGETPPQRPKQEFTYSAAMTARGTLAAAGTNPHIGALSGGTRRIRLQSVRVDATIATTAAYLEYQLIKVPRFWYTGANISSSLPSIAFDSNAPPAVGIAWGASGTAMVILESKIIATKNLWTSVTATPAMRYEPTSSYTFNFPTELNQPTLDSAMEAFIVRIQGSTSTATSGTSMFTWIEEIP